MKEGEFVQANTLLLFPNTQDTIMDYHGDANEILLKSTNQMLNRAQNPVT
jgi:hypothetical protein